MVASKGEVLAWVSAMFMAGTALAVNISTVPVGDTGNAADVRYAGYGSVDYTYSIGKYEVTAGKYAEFLNKVGGIDTYNLYNPSMANLSTGCGISRSGDGTPGSPYSYTVADDFVNRPVSYVSFWDACRFANWLHNGQPSGTQGAGTTETGAYTLTAEGIDYNTVSRNAEWKWAVTGANEWYKAAYYKGGSADAGYFDYPTSSDVAPGRDMIDPTGNNANLYTGKGEYPIYGDKFSTIVGEYENSQSPYGTFDQGGNMWEWNEGVVYGSFRGLWGGSFSNDVSYLLASNCIYSNYPLDENGNVGFRVVAIPEPATIWMLVLLGMAAIRRGRAQAVLHLP